MPRGKVLGEFDGYEKADRSTEGVQSVPSIGQKSNGLLRAGAGAMTGVLVVRALSETVKTSAIFEKRRFPSGAKWGVATSSAVPTKRRAWAGEKRS